MKYAAFLRGINVGGNVLIKMVDVKKVFENAGFKNVITVLASGNVIFDAKKTNADALAKKIEAALKKKCERDIFASVRSIDELRDMEKSQPFKGINVTSETRLYVTFFYEKPKSHLKSPSKFFRVMKADDSAICTVLVLTPDRATLDLMGTLEKHYGKRITTRNWNTIQKLINASG